MCCRPAFQDSGFIDCAYLLCLEIRCWHGAVSHLSFVVAVCPVMLAWVMHSEQGMCTVYYSEFSFKWRAREWIDGKVSFSFSLVWNLVFNMTSEQVSFLFFCPEHIPKTCHTTWCNQQSAHRRPWVWNSRSFAAWSWMVLAELFEEVCLVPACIVLSQFQRACSLYLVRMTSSQNSQGIMYLLVRNAANALFSFSGACFCIAA